MIEVISEEAVQVYRARFRQQIRQALRVFFNKESAWRGLTEKEMAVRLGIHEVSIRNKLNGETDLSLTDISDLARAMGGRAELYIVRPMKETIHEKEERG